MRWLVDDGHRCKPGEPIAYCNIGVRPSSPPYDRVPFPDESHDLQIAFAPRVSGTLRKADLVSYGGFLDQLTSHQTWLPELTIGHLEFAPGERPPPSRTASELRPLFLAGRRTTNLAEGQIGLLAGWFDRSRAWWGEGDRFRTILSVGLCEQLGIFRGERNAFLELFAALPGPIHFVFVPDDVIVPCARTLLEQFRRTPAELAAIADDLVRTFSAGSRDGRELLFAGALLAALSQSPLRDRYNVLMRAGLRTAGPADAVVLSLTAEGADVLRHRRLGYTLNLWEFRVAENGPGVRTWLDENFEKVPVSCDDVRRDYAALVDAVRAEREVEFFVLNRMSSAIEDDVHGYALFERPLGDLLASVRKKELNLMVHDLAREGKLTIVDLDRAAAKFGGAAHLPDGIHQTRALADELRGEVLRLLRKRQVI
ncbi:MAG: hypothetical protein JO359_09920 [Candidatus Eremiobacteraeota bacterium]|nr:hypothetical protein [Candidatus Eremiobacteraeota bacterium]